MHRSPVVLRATNLQSQEDRSSVRIHFSALDFKLWTLGPPDIDRVRPPHCPCCGSVGHALDDRIQLVGHGVRRRSVRGVIVWGETPRSWSVFCRRYRCRGCRAVVVVAPRGLLSRRQYLASAIALALVLYGVDGLSHSRVRQAVNPDRHHGFDADGRWRTLTRWIDDVGRGLLGRLLRPPSGTPRRQVAATYARALSVRSLCHDAIIQVSAMDGAMMATCL